MLGTLEAESASSGFCRLRGAGPVLGGWDRDSACRRHQGPRSDCDPSMDLLSLGLAPDTARGCFLFWGSLLGSWIHLGRRLADPLTVLCPEVISLLRRGRKGPQGLWHSCRPGPTGQRPEDWVSEAPWEGRWAWGSNGLGWSPQAPPAGG